MHTHSSKAGALGRTAAHRLEIGRIVHTFHGFPFHQFQSWPRRTAYIKIEQWVGRYTDVFLAVGPAVAAEAITRRIASAERVRTIGVGVAKTPDAPDAQERAKARRLLGVPPGMRVVGTVGRLAYQKAPEHFVRALAGLGRSDVFGVWIGDGPLRARTERLAGRYGLSGRMLFTGERADVEVLLPGLDVFAMASRYEGSVRHSRGDGRRAAGRRDRGQLGAQRSHRRGDRTARAAGNAGDLLGRAIGYLIRHPERATRLGLAGRQSLSDALGPAALGRVLDDTYRSITWATGGAVPVLPRQQSREDRGGSGTVLAHQRPTRFAGGPFTARRGTAR